MLVDTVDVAFFAEYLDHIRDVIGDRPVDYLIINHMEPDHSGSISLIRKYYPGIRLVGNKKTFEMVEGFYSEPTEDALVVADGDTLDLGYHKLRFYLAPMLHWPETMVSFDETEGILFSGDAFGCFGALNGNVVDEQMDTAPYWSEMERYYAAILGKFSPMVKRALAKLGGLPIKTICSTHGPVWRKDVARAVGTYDRLSRGVTEPGVVVCYGSMYGNTQRVAEAVAAGAAEAGMKKIVVHNLSVSQPSFVLADIFRYSGLAIGGPTYNGGLFPVVEDLLKRLAGREVSQHKLAYFGGFTWASAACKTIAHYNEKMRMDVVGLPVEWKQGVGALTLEAARTMHPGLPEMHPTSLVIEGGGELHVALDDVVHVFGEGLAYLAVTSERAGQLVTAPAVVAHHAFGVVDAAGRFGESHEAGDVVGRSLAGLDERGQTVHLGVGRVVQGVDGRQGQLAFGHVVARGFPDGGLLVVVEDVVADLEADADDLAEFARRSGNFRRGARGDGAQFGAGGEEGRCLLADDGKVCLLAHGLGMDVRQLQNFALGERFAQLRDACDDVGVAGQGGLLERTGKQVVAHEDGHLVVVDGVDRGLAAAFVALVDDVVVHEACRVEQFERHGRVYGSLVDASRGLGREQHKDGAHHLALPVSDVRQCASQQAVGVLQSGVEDFLIVGKFAFDGASDE